MQIKRVLNNNTCIAINHDGVSVLLMGPGIAFGKKRGQAVDMAKVEKTFFLKDQATMNKFTDLVIDVPLQEVDASERVINYAKIKLGKQLNENIYVNLTDHLHMAIKRFKEEGISLSNPLKWDIARFYPDEFAVGKKAVAVVKDAFDVDLGDDEAAFIAVHFINAEAGTDAEQNLAIGVTTIVKEVEDLVKAYFHTEFDEQSLNYYRFITHLKFFAQRILLGKHYEDDEDGDLLKTVQVRYAKPYACTLEIRKFIQNKYQFEINNSELLYLTVHINRLVRNL
ncbi:BglG family transcription antiterminator LicT [Lacticaseibacillus manihotivorans]|uniref:Transcription antiterminator n=2 Tax=Lacticaseibacillus manihotivorans TaxID=88233 RepID=A0A0R1QSM8_9LACO|nr:PRD domain-containing protein [Lacticaseibacillus manihotivorans]KRL45074.1 transcription antiterminator [Lacticaseibacillus manihotivorans DSM 13343 = JCM 12514]QFQ90963.1 PRD domain-containing protein [Lacticaseibacillus manihotivorans]